MMTFFSLDIVKKNVKNSHMKTTFSRWFFPAEFNFEVILNNSSVVELPLQSFLSVFPHSTVGSFEATSNL